VNLEWKKVLFEASVIQIFQRRSNASSDDVCYIVRMVELTDTNQTKNKRESQ